MTNHYTTLGVPTDATEDQIKVAYRKLAMELHPDRNPGNAEAEAKFKEVSEAYDTLKDAQKRAAYDASINQPKDFGFRHTPWGAEFTMRSGDFNNIDEMLRAFQEQRNKPRNRHYNTHCQIGLQDAFSGCEITLNLLDKQIKVKVPAGVDNGTRIRVAGAGERAHENIPPGDLFVNVSVIPDERFNRSGRHLYSDVHVNAIDAMLGEKFSAETIDGDRVEISPPAGIQSGWKVRVSGRGMPNIGTGERGDMIVTVIVTTPQNLTDQQKDLLREIKRLSN